MSRGGSEDTDFSTPKLRGYLEVKHCPTNGRSRARLPRKMWRRQWVVLDIVETLDTPALIGRIYSSHLHEDRTLPSTTVTLTDVHALHRMQSRSHPFAFSIDGNCQCLILSGPTETESQLWMKQIRQLLWPRTPPIQLWPRQDFSSSLFEVSLIDNVHSDIVRLRGFYGHLVIEGRDLILLEARSGADQIRWTIKSLKKWFCAKVSHKEDRGKILVIISHKTCSSGEGIFTFYAPRAREIVNALEATTRTAQRQPLSALEGKKVGKMNPLLAFLRRGSTPTSPSLTRAQQLRDPESSKSGQKSKKKSQLNKSASVMEHLSPRHSSSAIDNGGFEARSRRTVAAPDMSNSASLSSLRRGISLERHTTCHTERNHSVKASHGDSKKVLSHSNKKKKSASESDLLSAGGMNNNQSKNGYGIPTSAYQDDPDFPAPPKPEDLLLMSASETLETVTGTEGQEGFYRSFDDIDDIDLGVLASSNPLEAAVVLRNQPETSGARYSFNSSDSGRMSDTYGETSNSSVASSSGHSNRICSNTSNCSGDSGAQMSDSSSKETRPLEVLKEQASPDYPPFDNELYGETISIVESSSGSTTSGQQSQQQQQQQQHHQQQQQQQQQQSQHKTSQDDKSEDYYYVPLRFATVRKSFTLPHNMSGSAATTPTVPHSGTLQSQKTKDLSKFLGLIDNGPGSPSREVAQAVAMQNLPQHLRSPNNEGKKNVEKFLGITDTISSHESRPLPSEPKRARPKSLGIVAGRSLERRASEDDDGSKKGHNNSESNPATLNRTLARLQRYYSTDSRSVPTTPEFNQALCFPTSPRKKNLTKFLGLGNEKQQQPLPDTPTAHSNSNGSSLVKNSLSSSTPMVLESCDTDDIYHSVSESSRWQSNDGLLTPGSIGGMSPFCRSPEASPVKSVKMTADKGVMTSDLEDPLGPYYNGYMFNPWNCPCQRATAYYGTASATSSPFHTGPRGGAGRGRAASVGRAQMSPLQRGGLGTISRARGVQMVKKLPRSMTLDDLDPEQYSDMHHNHQHHMQQQQQQQQRLHYCQPPQSPMCGPPILRISRRESLGYEPCHSPCQLAHQHPGHPVRGECCIPDAFCPSSQQQLQQQQHQRSSSLCRQQQQQQQQYHHQHQSMDCNSLNRISSKARGDGSCRSCASETLYSKMGENSVPTSLGVVVIPIAPKPNLHQQQQQVSIVSKQNNCSVMTSSTGYGRDGVGCCQTESDYLDMASIRSHQQKSRREEPPLRESSVDTDSILVDGEHQKHRFLTSTVVGVGLGGKTCISVNEGESRHKVDSSSTSVKIWTSSSSSTSTQMSNDASTTFVQTTAIIHPTPPT